MRVFVTGGNGFIGSVVVRELVAAGHEVTCLLRPTSNTDRLDGVHHERASGDVRDAASVKAAMAGAEAVIHLASLSSWDLIDSPEMKDVVLGGTANVLDAARELGGIRVVFVSSVTAVGATSEPTPLDESAPYNLDHERGLTYSRFKHEAEELCRAAVERGQDVVVVNPAEVYGPGDVALITAGNLVDFATSNPVLVCNGGTSVVYVDDVALGIVRAMERGVTGERYILGGPNVTLRELATHTLDLLGRTSKILGPAQPAHPPGHPGRDQPAHQAALQPAGDSLRHSLLVRQRQQGRARAGRLVSRRPRDPGPDPRLAEGDRTHPVTRAVAIVGMGARLPGAPSVLGLADVVERGRVPVRPVPQARWNHDQFYDPNPRRLDRTYARVLASVDDIDRFAPEFFGILPRRARFMDPQQRLLLDAARAALEDAGRGPGTLPRSTGVYIGISVSEYYQLTTARVHLMQAAGGRFGRVPRGLDEVWDVLSENVPPIQAHSMVGQMLNMSAANLAQAFDLGGPAFATDSACSSALVALGEAILHLREGVCDAALVGGVYIACTPGNMIAFSRIGAISPSDACRPFDQRADGFVLGEGAGCVLLKRLEDAIADGDRIWAVVRGFGVNNDGRAEGPMTPRLGGQVACMERAYADADASPAEVGLVEAHGTATRVGDMVEAGSLAQVFGPARRGVSGLAPCWVTSVKSNIGHTLAAAGAAGLMSATLSLARRRIAPLAGFERVRGDLPLADAGAQVATEASDWDRAAGGGRRMAAVSSFGFGGTNVHVVLEEAPEGAAPRRARAALAGAQPDADGPARRRIGPARRMSPSCSW